MLQMPCILWWVPRLVIFWMNCDARNPGIIGYQELAEWDRQMSTCQSQENVQCRAFPLNIRWRYGQIHWVSTGRYELHIPWQSGSLQLSSSIIQLPTDCCWRQNQVCSDLTWWWPSSQAIWGLYWNGTVLTANLLELWHSVQLQFVLSYLITLCHRFHAKYPPRMSVRYHYGALEKNWQSRTWKRKVFWRTHGPHALRHIWCQSSSLQNLSSNGQRFFALPHRWSIHIWLMICWMTTWPRMILTHSSQYLMINSL